MNFMFLKVVIYQFVKMITLVPIYIKIKMNPDGYTLEEKFAIINKYTSDALKFSGIELNISGYDNLPDKDENVLFVSNHANWIDAFILLTVMDRPSAMIVAKEANWEDTPFVRGWMNMINCLHIDRVNNRNALRTIKEASEILKNTSSVGVFPEGVVTLSDELAPFKDGVFRMAIKAKVPIVPVHIKNSKDILKITSRWTGKAYASDVEVNILEPVMVHIDNESMKTKELSEIVKKAFVDNGSVSESMKEVA